jgi:predicted amidohydrolase
MKQGTTRRALLGGAAAAMVAQAAPAASEPAKRREVWVAGLTMDGLSPRSKEQCVEQVLARMDQFASRKPDVVCLTETFQLAAVQPRQKYEQLAEPIPGPTTDRMARWAREHRSYVICPIHERQGGKIYNTAVVLDRQGQVAGAYRKVHVVENEMEAGASCGRGAAKAIPTDFGRIGVQICFDVNWPDGWAALKKDGADIVFWPSAYPGGRALYPRAWQNIYHLVSVPWAKPGAAEVIDPSGDIVAASGQWEPWVCASVNLEKGLFHLDFQQDKVRKIEAKYGRGVRVKWLHLENWFLLEAVDPELTIAGLKAEFGLVPLDEYLARAERAQAADRSA